MRSNEPFWFNAICSLISLLWISHCISVANLCTLICKILFPKFNIPALLVLCFPTSTFNVFTSVFTFLLKVEDNFLIADLSHDDC